MPFLSSGVRRHFTYFEFYFSFGFLIERVGVSVCAATGFSKVHSSDCRYVANNNYNSKQKEIIQVEYKETRFRIEELLQQKVDQLIMFIIFAFSAESTIISVRK